MRLATWYLRQTHRHDLASGSVASCRVEMFCRNDARHDSLETQEYFDLRLVDLGANFTPRFLIREIHARWSDSLKRVVWDGFENDNCRIPEEAQRCYDNRKAVIHAKGFTCSNMEHSKAS